MGWFIFSDAAVDGPFEFAEIDSRIQRGEITADTILARSADGPWARATEIFPVAFGREGTPALEPTMSTSQARTLSLVHLEEPFWIADREPGGPFSFAELREMWKSGQLTGEQLFGQEKSSWRMLSTIKHLLDATGEGPSFGESVAPGAAGRPRKSAEIISPLGCVVLICVLVLAIATIVMLIYPGNPW